MSGTEPEASEGLSKRIERLGYRVTLEVPCGGILGANPNCYI
jgi:hypothetical protein